MIRRLLDYLWFRSCEHIWEPYFYGRLMSDDNIVVVIDVCTECGATITHPA